MQTLFLPYVLSWISSTPLRFCQYSLSRSILGLFLFLSVAHGVCLWITTFQWWGLPGYPPTSWHTWDNQAHLVVITQSAGSLLKLEANLHSLPEWCTASVSAPLCLVSLLYLRKLLISLCKSLDASLQWCSCVREISEQIFVSVWIKPQRLAFTNRPTT